MASGTNRGKWIKSLVIRLWDEPVFSLLLPSLIHCNSQPDGTFSLVTANGRMHATGNGDSKFSTWFTLSQWRDFLVASINTNGQTHQPVNFFLEMALGREKRTSFDCSFRTLVKVHLSLASAAAPFYPKG